MDRLRAGLIGFLLAASACDRVIPARSALTTDEAGGQSAMVIDSVLPPGETLRRFQAGLIPARGFSAAVRSRDDLVGRFIRAVENNDSPALDSLVVTKSEYAFLYFPTSIHSRKPYELPPEIAWLLMEQNSLKGLTRVKRRLGGQRLNFRGYECDEPLSEGDNRFWRTCRVKYTDPASGVVVTRQLFGAIMERHARYKFLSYANDF